MNQTTQRYPYSCKRQIISFDYAKALTGGVPARSIMLIGIRIHIVTFGDTPKFSTANPESILRFMVIALFSSSSSLFLPEAGGEQGTTSNNHKGKPARDSLRCCNW